MPFVHHFQQEFKKLQKDHIAIAGIPFDAYSSFMRGPALAPSLIWEAFHSDSANYYTESGLDLKDHAKMNYLGEMPLTRYEDIELQADAILDKAGKLLSLGGDHSVTYPLVKAHAKKHEDITILHLDAHTDLYDDFEGNPYSHASPFARIMEEGLATRLIQVGIRTHTSHTREQAERFGVETWEMKDLYGGLPKLELSGAVYLSLDLDVLDPAFAPGLSHHEPGGMSTREVLQLLHSIKVPLIGADIVEYNPRRDIQEVTAMVAAKMLKEVFELLLF